MGHLHVYTGDGKGKTTCAVGLAVRAAGAGLRVAFIQFDKGFEGTNEHYHERFILRQLPLVEMFFFGMERMMPDGKFRFQNIPADFEQAQAGLDRVREILRQRKHDMVICDEAITCIGTGLLAAAELMQVVMEFKSDPESELVLTGRGALPELIDTADLVTEMRLVKHYWYTHKTPARKGIDY